MPDQLNELMALIVEGLRDPEGPGSDLAVMDYCGHGEWAYLEGNLDVQHLAASILDRYTLTPKTQTTENGK